MLGTTDYNWRNISKIQQDYQRASEPLFGPDAQPITLPCFKRKEQGLVTPTAPNNAATNQGKRSKGVNVPLIEVTENQDKEALGCQALLLPAT